MDKNGRPAEEPTRMLAVLILQFMEGLPDRKAVEACTYDLRWKLALWMEADEPAFHATRLVKFRNRLLKHELVEIGFDAVLGAMRKAGYLKAHKAQRLDSTHVAGLVSHMSRLECVRESVRLALEVLAELPEVQRPESWPVWWEREDLGKPAELYVDGGYTSGEVLAPALSGTMHFARHANTAHAASEPTTSTAPWWSANITSTPRHVAAK